MGRPKKPVEKHLQEGTYRPHRHGPAPGDPAEGVSPPVKPGDLTGDAADLWAHLLQVLRGVVGERDTVQLASLCRWLARVREIESALAGAEMGSVAYARLLRCLSTAADHADRTAARFGLSPRDRIRLPPAVGPAVARVASRPQTKMDLQGRPPGQ